MSILRIFKKETHADPAMLAKQADEATAIHSITVPKYRVKGNFVEYVVECSRISTTWQVYRRYQQFKALDQQLKTLCQMTSPNHCEFGVVPVLCATHWTEVTNQSPELVERRRRYLEIYLQQLLCPKNLFYAAKTALHGFLHDGEVPILHKSRNNRPLPGFGMLPPTGDNHTGFAKDKDGKDKVVGKEGAINADNKTREANKGQAYDDDGDEAGQHKQVVAGMTNKEQHNVHSGALPDLTKGRGAKGDEAANAAAFVDPMAGASADSCFEKCTRCGYQALIDYDVTEWVAEGRCAQCKEHATFSLVRPGDAAAATAVKAADASTSSASASASTSAAVKAVDGAGNASLKGAYGDEIAGASDSSDDGLEPFDEDDRRASIGFACNNCRRVFDINLVPRRCYLCTSSYCRACTKKAPKADVDRTMKDHVGDCASPSRGSCAASPSGKASGAAGDGKRVRVCDRCYANYERHLTSPAVGATSPLPLPGATAAGGATPSADSLQVPASPAPVLGTSPHQAAVSLLVNGKERPATLALPTATAATTGGGVSSPTYAPRTKDIALSDFQLVTTLGRGTFGKVLKVRYMPTGDVFAMKVLNKSVIHKRRMVDYIREEKNIMSYIPPHPFICTCHYNFQTEYHVFFVLDYLCGGELYTHIYPNRTITEADARIYIAEIILGVEHMHKHDVCHRDLKPENIVLDRDGHLKITDFGLARMNFSRVRRRSFVGSAEYLAPETIQGDVQTKALDWWSVGVMLYELLSGVAPFHAATNNEVYQAVLNKKLDFSTHRDSFSPTAQNLISRMLEKDIRLRLTDPEKIKHHPFFDGLDWHKLANRQITPPFVPNLNDNDTKYFNRDFTSEWATIRNPHGVGRQTAEMLTRRFSNFRVVPDIRKGEMPKFPQTNNGRALSALEMGKSADGTAAAEHAAADLVEAHASLSLVSPQSFVGVWRLVTVEMVTSAGQTCYPWGSEAIGILKYTENGLYALQLCPMKRPKFKNTSADKITRDELADAYLSYVGSFGTYEVLPGKSYITQTPTGALCPNSVGSAEKWFFELLAEDRLRLMTTPMPAEEGMVARTVVTWERVSK